MTKDEDLYEKTLEKPELELIVTVYNVNMGMNQQLLEACTALKEYAEYVAAVRSYLEYLPVEEAVECAVTECIEKGILRDFLSQNRTEEQIVCKLVKRFQINRETAEEYYRKALEKNK